MKELKLDSTDFPAFADTACSLVIPAVVGRQSAVRSGYTHYVGRVAVLIVYLLQGGPGLPDDLRVFCYFTESLY